MGNYENSKRSELNTTLLLINLKFLSNHAGILLSSSQHDSLMFFRLKLSWNLWYGPWKYVKIKIQNTVLRNLLFVYFFIMKFLCIHSPTKKEKKSYLIVYAHFSFFLLVKFSTLMYEMLQIIDTLLGKVVKDFSAVLVSQGTQVLKI